MRLFRKPDGPQAGSTTIAPDAGGHDVALPGITLHYASWGQPAPERTVLLIHGLTANHKEFLALGPYLAEHGWHVIAPDLRGRGLSTKPRRGYGISIHAADIQALCDALNIEKPALVGHSLGAIIGMYLAATAPDFLSKLVMVDAGGTIPEDTAQAIAASVNRLGMVYPSLDEYLGAMSKLPVFTWNADWEAYFRYDADVRPDGTVVSRVPKAAIEEESLALALTRTEALAGLVRCPTLMTRATVGLLGEGRGFILTREEAERLNGIIPQSRIAEIEGANHYTIIAAPALLEATARFLEA